jgi:hypothetical protein
MAISHLTRVGSLSDRDIIQIQLVMEQETDKNMSKTLGICRSALNDRFTAISEKIASVLGEQYQDDKILEEVGRRLHRPLTDDETDFCNEVIRKGKAFRDGANVVNFRKTGDGKFVVGENKEKG